MVTRIHKGAPNRFYIREHIEASPEAVERIVGRMRTVNSRQTLWRWAKRPQAVKQHQAADLAQALGYGDDWERLTRLPGRDSIDAVLNNAPPEVYQAVSDLAKALTKKAS